MSCTPYQMYVTNTALCECCYFAAPRIRRRFNVDHGVPWCLEILRCGERFGRLSAALLTLMGSLANGERGVEACLRALRALRRLCGASIKLCCRRSRAGAVSHFRGLFPALYFALGVVIGSFLDTDLVLLL